jgi:hypothetical protein
MKTYKTSLNETLMKSTNTCPRGLKNKSHLCRGRELSGIADRDMPKGNRKDGQGGTLIELDLENLNIGVCHCKDI